MKTLQAVLLTAITALALGCGYSSKAVTPPVAGTMPTIAQLSPNSATSGGAALILTVNGTNFAANATVNLSGAAQSTTHVSTSQLTISVPASAIATAGTLSVTVTNPGTAGGIYGGGTQAETSAAMDFTVQ
jgi:type IV pilus biogenesis protein CpaD/CtpE